MRATHTITINQDDICENTPNENFFIAINSDLPIVIVIRQRTEVIIDDSECSKCHILFCCVMLLPTNRIYVVIGMVGGEREKIISQAG